MSAKPYDNLIHLALVGINVVHDSSYTVDRRTGSDEYLFEFFHSPVLLQDEQERRLQEGNVFILYAPGQPQFFRAEGPLTHTWFQASGKGIAECIERYRIPVNQATPLTHPEFLAPLLKEALRHTVRRQRNWEDAITEAVRGLFRHLSRRLYETESVVLTPYQKQILATLYGVRAQVYKNLKRRWTVEDMAALASMSVQRFAVTYRENFGIGPIDDLIGIRLRHTEVLLRHLPVTVTEAARHFGFNTVSNFHVLFRERMGRSPRELVRTGERPTTHALLPEDYLEESEAAKIVHLLYIEPVGHWSFDRIEADMVDDLRKHPAATLYNNVTLSRGYREGSSLHLDAASYAVVPETIVDTSQSYTVCAWLSPHAIARMTAISIGNDHHGAFYLQYVPAEGGFKFAVTVSERDPMAIFKTSITPVAVGEWYFVTGIHDRENQEIRLYVDGRLEGRTPFETPWRAEGATYFGGCKVMDTMVDHWRGGIDEVRIYDRVLSPAEIALIHRGEVK